MCDCEILSLSGRVRLAYLIAKNRDANVALVVDARMIDLGGERDLKRCLTDDLHVVGRTHSWGLEREVVGQSESKVECSTLVWAVVLQRYACISCQQPETRPVACTERTDALMLHRHISILSSSGVTLRP